MMGARNCRSDFVSPGTTYAAISYRIVGAANRIPEYPPTCNVVKKNSPGDSCRNRTPCSATGASRNSTRSFEYRKQMATAEAPAIAPAITRSRSSSRWSHIGISKSPGSSAGFGDRNFCRSVDDDDDDDAGSVSCSGVLEARVTTERGVDDVDEYDDAALGCATHRALAPPVVVGIVRFRPTSTTPTTPTPPTPPTPNPPNAAMDILAPCVCDALSECTSVRLVRKWTESEVGGFGGSLGSVSVRAHTFFH